MAALPSPRHLITSLISSISNNLSTSTATAETTASTTGNPLKDTPPETQKLLLTLHILFPNELLPALDLLDRGLVTRFFVSQHQPHQAPDRDEQQRRRTIIYYVQSARPQQTRHRASAAAQQYTTSYEVRLQSWSCSCPAFTFAAFPADAPSTASSVEEVSGRKHHSGRGYGEWTFGGLTIGTDMPVCKHVLACVLVERCEMFKSFALKQEVSVEELAGWAAGWGN